MRGIYGRISESSDKAFDILKKYVPCSLEPYSVDKYHYNIGYGHRVSTYHGEKSEKITQEQADNFFKEDLRDVSMSWAYDIARKIADTDKVVLNQNQFDAITCYVYTIGISNWLELDHNSTIDMYAVRKWILADEIPTKPEPGNWWYESALEGYKQNARSYIDSRIPRKIDVFFGKPHMSCECSISDYGDDVITMLLFLFREIRALYNTPVDNPEDYPQIIIRDNPYSHINQYEALSTLHNGEHDYVRWVQFEISRTEIIDIDGKFTRDFRDRLMGFQKSLGLEETGIIDYKLYQALDERYQNAKNNIR